ncbi:hypothetical protein Xmau_04160 [Xenorhabdus mauleonii]|uniref:Uncharacterized protein n=1 Tax=Xenorhabdus mauleonii TaxID=351675 RepID=A0A1I3WXW2_9GAMM|nr:hypothetical protein Xmau_04160 [Xenorhabdus mauleonii]SFK12190.1 hypothetical protein SAMN05421680_13028 [Xenorhabdus mauleonii]
MNNGLHMPAAFQIVVLLTVLIRFRLQHFLLG